MFEAVFPLLNAFARIPVCGLIAHYNNTEAVTPKWASAMMRNVLTKRLTIRGFIVSDFAARHGDFLRDMSGWVRERKVKHKEFVTEGLDSAPTAFMGLLKGAISASNWCASGRTRREWPAQSAPAKTAKALGLTVPTSLLLRAD